MITTEAAFVTGGNLSIRDLALRCESYLEQLDTVDVRSWFWQERTGETVTMSEVLSGSIRTPDKTTFDEMYAAYQAIVQATPECVGDGWASWACCDTHLCLLYVRMLLRAIATAYNVRTEGQPLSQQWWRDFNVLNEVQP